MANLQKHRAHESLNTDSAATWVEGTMASSASTAVLDVSSYHTIHIQFEEDIYFTFANTSADSINTPTDLYLKGGDTIYSLKVPHGVGSNVHFQIQRKTTSCTVNYALG